MRPHLSASRQAPPTREAARSCTDQRTWTRLACGLLFLLFGSIALTANASPASERPRLAAHVLRASGLRQLRSGELAAAARSFEEAYRLLPDADGLYLLCSLAHLEGRITAAKDLARRYLIETDSDPSQKPRAAGRLESSRDPSRAEARRILELPDGPAGEVALLGPPGAWVVVDDRLVGRLPLARPLGVPAGAHRVAVDCGPARSVVRADIAVASGRPLELRVRADTDSMLVTRVPALLVLLDQSALAPGAESRLLKAIAAAAQREHLVVVSAPPAAEPATQPGGCRESRECLAALAQRADAAYVLDARVSGPPPPLEAGDWQLDLRLLSAATGELATSRTLSCAACSAARAAELAQTELADALALASARPRGELVVNSEPAGAAVYSAGQRLGTTPYRRAAWTGDKQLELRRDGYRIWTGRAAIEEARPTTLSIKLQPLPEPTALAGSAATAAPPPAAPPAPVFRAAERGAAARPRWRLITGGLSLAAGSLLVGFGASALATDGLCSPDTPPAASECRSKYNAAPAGGALLGSGVALLAAGGVLLIVPGRRPMLPRPRP
ncbi:MAG TPA: PEGA domain-containing protein [Pseudomonadota bacterium]|nr:PEGA domain-containing protein [Pseudomonadota bacterium]